MFLAFPLALIHIGGIKAADWTVTYYVETTAYQYPTTVSYHLEPARTSFLTLYSTSIAKSGITPSEKPTAVTVTRRSFDDVGEVEETQYYVPFGAIASEDARYWDNDIEPRDTAWVSPIVYAAATSCHTLFSYTIWSRIDMPYGVATQLSPVSTKKGDDHTVFLSANALPSRATPPSTKYYEQYGA
jgi:hypothetical protein